MILLAELNVDILLEIFSYLDKKALVSIAQTCTAIYSIAYHPSLWKHHLIRFKTDEKLSDGTAVSFRSRGIRGCKIKLPVPAPLEDEWERRFYSRNENTIPVTDQHDREELIRSIQTMTKDNMQVLVSLSSVERLSLQHSTSEYNILSMFPISFNSLRHLDIVIHIPRTKNRQDKILEDFSYALSCVVNLQYFSCELIGPPRRCGNMPIPRLAGAYLQLILHSLPRLEDLTLKETGCSVNKTIDLIIKEIGCSVNKTVDKGMTFPKLKRLSIPRANRSISRFRRRPEEDDPFELSQRFPNMKHFEVSSSRVSSLISQLDGIESFVIHDLSASSDEDKLTLPPMGNLLALGLRMWGYSSDYVVPLVSGMKFTKLKALSITCEYSRQKIGVEEIVRSASAPHLEVLSIIQHPDEANQKVADGVLTEIETKMPKLVSLLGVECMDNPNLPSSVTYVTRCVLSSSAARDRPEGRLEVMRKSASSKWLPVLKGSRIWREAMGDKYFKPNSGD